MIGQSEQKRCVELEGRKACVSLEGDFWECLDEIALHCGICLDRLVAYVGGDADDDELSGLLRVFVLTYYQEGTGSLPHASENIRVIDRSPPDRLVDKRSFH